MTLPTAYAPDAVEAAEAEALQAVVSGERPFVDLDSRETLETQDFKFLIRLLRRVRDKGGELALMTGKPQHRRVLGVTGLDRVFPIIVREAA